MSEFMIDAFTILPHTLIIEPAGFETCGVVPRECWSYRLYCGDSLIFEGKDLRTPVGVSEDQVAARALGFLTLRPGDTEDEYFADYSQDQFAWCEENADMLGLCLIGEGGTERDDLSCYRVG
ncbi:hypothetical protein O4J56_04615 [Nocardiopsis sp. RSe5-2]|uniref:Uncharacterized protein n=1 Tax=Nocardiopsis endophytica TaxID=3018445 RepID=A0ABT4TYY3_9ACTN|nr:hypothetical protein [Nocardiopsis endophytica]MDA2809912.1 hypothetical protein [Nocardiopsis endophytica]